jgi:type I restriction enzyme S subunit
MQDIQQIITDHINIWTTAKSKKKSNRGRSVSNAARIYGVEKLRELILNLAIEGKLVPQDPNDEPASELIKRIESGRIKLLKTKKRNPWKPIANEKASLQLPNGWVLIQIDDIAFSQAGYAFKSNSFNETGVGLPLIRIRDVGQEFTGTFFSGDYKEEFLVKKDDYLISMDGEFRIAKCNLEKGLLNQRVSRLIFYSNDINKDFIAIALQVKLTQLQGIKAYTTVDHLSGEQISSSQIALPPQDEQQRITKKLNELMTICTQLEQQHIHSENTHEKLVKVLLDTLTQSKDAEEFKDSWQRIASHFHILFSTEDSIDELKQVLLQLAVMGKLVPQDSNDEPASELLKRVQTSKIKLIAEGKLKKEKPLAPIAEDEKPFALSRGWEFVRLSYVANLENGDRGKNYPNKDALVKEGIPFVNAGHLENGFINKSQMTFITLQRFNLLSGGKFIEDDILFCLRGSLGKCALVKGITKGAIASSLVIIRINSNVHLSYFYNYLISNLLTQSVKKYDNGTAQPNLSSADLGKFVIPIPPISEQHRIVAKLDELISLCDQLKTYIQQASAKQKQIADVLVSQALH